MSPSSRYPANVKPAAQRALFNNLGKDVGLALAVDAAVQSSRMEGWRVNAMKTKRVRVAIKKTLKGDDALADRVLELAKHQNDY